MGNLLSRHLLADLRGIASLPWEEDDIFVVGGDAGGRLLDEGWGSNAARSTFPGRSAACRCLGQPVEGVGVVTIAALARPPIASV